MDEPKHNTVPQVINGRINGRFAPGFSGNPGGSPEATRRAFNKRFPACDLAEDLQQHGSRCSSEFGASCRPRI